MSVFLSVFGEGGRTGGGGGDVPVDPPTNLTLPFFDVGSSTVIGGEWLLNPGGVGGAVILDGKLPHVMLLEIFTQRGVGTLFRRN